MRYAIGICNNAICLQNLEKQCFYYTVKTRPKVYSALENRLMHGLGTKLQACHNTVQ